MKPQIGVIGHGFVGQALVQGFSLYADILIYDKYEKGLDTLERTIEKSDFIFICVPTPMERIEGGPIDLSIIESVVEDIAHLHTIPIDDKIIILKSTVTPGTTRSLQEKYPHMNFCFNPEFLTERNFLLDFINTTRIVLGGEDDITKRVARMYRIRFSHTPIKCVNFEVAEMTKYFANCFFAVKIAFCNEIYQMCEGLNISYNELKDVVLLDGRIGNSHLDVPGHDGQFGFGGKCFPKDVNALLGLADELGVELNTLEAAWETNLKIREEYDWAEIKGATSKNLHT